MITSCHNVNIFKTRHKKIETKKVKIVNNTFNDIYDFGHNQGSYQNK